MDSVAVYLGGTRELYANLSLRGVAMELAPNGQNQKFGLLSPSSSLIDTDVQFRYSGVDVADDVIVIHEVFSGPRWVRPFTEPSRHGHKNRGVSVAEKKISSIL